MSIPNRKERRNFLKKKKSSKLSEWSQKVKISQEIGKKIHFAKVEQQHQMEIESSAAKDASIKKNLIDFYKDPNVAANVYMRNKRIERLNS